MRDREPFDDDSPPPTGPQGRFADDLIGLDPEDPETKEFAAHLDRMQRNRSGYTFEGVQAGLGDFADGVDRSSEGRRAVAKVVAALIVAPFLVALALGAGTLITWVLDRLVG